MMNEIKGYATLLEEDLSLLNMFYNGKKAWPENILKIRQTIYKKRHAQVLVGSGRHCATRHTCRFTQEPRVGFRHRERRFRVYKEAPAFAAGPVRRIQFSKCVG